MKTSLIIVGFFILGFFGGYADLLPESLGGSELSTYVLYLLMFLVGLSIGSDRRLKEILRTLRPKVLLVPLSTIVGAFVGAALISLVISRWSPADCMAVGSGMGYYSLSSILIADLREASLGIQAATALGTVALVSNILRELFTFLGAPLLARYFGPLAPINAGGATTMDSTLPIISRTSGEKWVFVAIIHGALTDLSVPFLVTFFCSL